MSRAHSKDATTLARRLRKMGFVVEKGGGGHWQVRNQRGDRIYSFPSTPSDWRWQMNATRDLRRAGVPI